MMRGTFLGVARRRMILFWGLHWCPYLAELRHCRRLLAWLTLLNSVYGAHGRLVQCVGTTPSTASWCAQIGMGVVPENWGPILVPLNIRCVM